MVMEAGVPIDLARPNPPLLSPDIAPRGDIARGIRASGEPSASSALERLASASQDMIVKRVDLALLEGQELLSRTLRGAALGALGMILAAAAWFAMAACVTRLVTDDSSAVVRLAIFGLLNAGGAIGLVTLARRRGRQQAPVRQNGSGTRVPVEPQRGRLLHSIKGENGRGTP